MVLMSIFTGMKQEWTTSTATRMCGWTGSLLKLSTARQTSMITVRSLPSSSRRAWADWEKLQNWSGLWANICIQSMIQSALWTISLDYQTAYIFQPNVDQIISMEGVFSMNVSNNHVLKVILKLVSTPMWSDKLMPWTFASRIRNIEVRTLENLFPVGL